MRPRIRNIDTETLKQAAKDGATWKDLANIIGVSERTLRRWREELEYADYHTEECYKEDYLVDLADEGVRPMPKKAGEILAITQAGRTEGRRELLNTIRQQAVQTQDISTQLLICKRSFVECGHSGHF